MKIKNIFIIFMSLLLTTSCGQPNVLTEYSNTDSDEAFYLDAKNKIDNFEWDAAIEILTTKISTGYQARSDVKTTLMHAYGGKCGISFFDLINSLKNVSSTKMFEFALQLYAGKTVDVVSCDKAVATLRSLGTTAADRTREQNLFAAILGLTRMATTLHAKLDTESSGLGNGVVDAGWDSCVIGGKLTDADMNKIVAGVGLIFENLAVLGDELTSGSAGSSFDSAKALCETTLPLPVIGTPHDWDNAIPVATKWSQLPIAPPLPDNPTWVDLGLPADFADPINCLNTQESAVPDKMRRIFRRMISSASMGFGACDIANVTLSVNTSSSPLAKVNSNCCPGLASP